MTELLALDHVSVRLGHTPVLDEVTLTISEGQQVALLGPSGSGKSTLLRVLLGFVAPERGLVRIRGEVVSEAGRIVIPPEERRLAVVFQDLALWPHLTVAGNLRFVLRSRPRTPDEDERIRTMLERVGLASKSDRYPGELSRGEQQRVAIARAFVLDPGAVLLDEPLTSLDIDLKRDLIQMLRGLLSTRNTTMLYVTHDPAEAAAMASTIAVLENRRLVHVGPPDGLVGAPASKFLNAVRQALFGG